MNTYEYITTSNVNNYMVKPKHIETTSSNIYSKPTPTPSNEALNIIAANQNSQLIRIKPISDVQGLLESYNSLIYTSDAADEKISVDL